MRLLPSLLILVVLASLPALSQNPTVGVIEIYGNRRVPPAEIRKLLGTKEGGQLPRSKPGVEDALAELDIVAAASLTATCCDPNGHVILYTGIQEEGAPAFLTREFPDGEVEFPQELHDAYFQWIDALRRVESANLAEDLSQGHSLVNDPGVQALQRAFIPLADKHADLLRKVLREDADDEHRAVAAYVLGYATDKAAIVEDLQFALADADATVRDNATRALSAIATFARNNPASAIAVSPERLIDMLNSVHWTDRTRAAAALSSLTESRDRKLLERIRDKALLSLVEMSRWKHREHALAPWILLGRIADVKESALQSAWKENRREDVIRRATTASSDK